MIKCSPSGAYLCSIRIYLFDIVYVLHLDMSPNPGNTYCHSGTLTSSQQSNGPYIPYPLLLIIAVVETVCSIEKAYVVHTHALDVWGVSYIAVAKHTLQWYNTKPQQRV